MHLWAEGQGDGTDTELFELDNNQEMDWRFDDWRTMREVRFYLFKIRNNLSWGKHFCPFLLPFPILKEVDPSFFAFVLVYDSSIQQIIHSTSWSNLGEFKEH